MIRTSIWDDGQETSREENTYDAAGNIIRHEQYSLEGYNGYDIANYNEKGQLTEVIVYEDGKETGRQTCTYAPDGTLTKITETENGEVKSVVTCSQKKVTMTRERAESLKDAFIFPYFMIEGDPVQP